MLIRFSHHKKLGYPAVSKKTALPISAEALSLEKQGSTLVTFRPPPSGWPDKHVKKLTALDRYLWLKSDDLIFYGLESDSPLAPLILWDVAHAASVNSRLTLLGESFGSSFLEREYFAESFVLEFCEAGKKVFRKTAPLPAEDNAGLEAWTFGIPVGPEDATLLNATVKRILELDVPVKEILLCGRPGSNFLYFDKVRIVGEDITAPPVKICAKKNRLAQEALHPNLCIIHDRVFLPLDFYRAVKEFGDFYPLTTFQSLFFDDKWNFVPRRYSDFGVSYKAKISSIKGLMRDNDESAPSVFSPATLPHIEMAGFFSASPLRFSLTSYPTGSMYLCKSAVWHKFPQNENLHWIEFEDLEHAYRAADGGVPSRVNPFAITQSLISRPLLGRIAGAFVEPMKGPPRLYRPWSEFLPLPRKPSIKMGRESALAAMSRFVEKYVPDHDALVFQTSVVLRSEKRLEFIIDMMSRVRVPLSEKGVRQFLSDYEKWVLLDQLPFSFIENACYRLLVGREKPVDVLVVHNDILKNHFANRLSVGTFYSSPEDYFQKKSVLSIFGTFVSSCSLYWNRRKVVYLDGGVLYYFKAIFNSTPFHSK
ncbi:hypothetical protein [Zoogloea sp.]|uniref:hypothetical protein n=1 Tax=Zoogloea sp. TaxID=49181 RepID=UPI0035AFA50C